MTTRRIIEYVLVIDKSVSLRTLVGMIHSYPTYSDVAKRAMSKLLVIELLTSPAGQLIKHLVQLLP